jgi:hypothetical protein
LELETRLLLPFSSVKASNGKDIFFPSLLGADVSKAVLSFGFLLKPQNQELTDKS